MRRRRKEEDDEDEEEEGGGEEEVVGRTAARNQRPTAPTYGSRSIRRGKR